MIVLKTKKTEQKATKIRNSTFFGHTSMSCTMFTQPFPLHIFLCFSYCIASQIGRTHDFPKYRSKYYK